MQLKKLVARCQNGERKALEELYRLYGEKLYALCLKYSRNRTEAEDNLQDSMITIFEKIDQYTFKGSFEGWLKRITLNTVLMKYRKDGVLNLVGPIEVPDSGVVIIESEEISLETLLSLIQELPDQYRLTFSLYVLDGYSHKEIAALLKISEGTSKSNLARAKAILRRRLNQLFNREIKSSGK